MIREIMLKISKGANKNYLAKVVKLKNLRKHENADRLQCVDVDFQNVVTGLTAKEGDFYVYFPVECSINSEFLAETNSFRKPELNVDKNVKGFFDVNGRVKAVKLRGERSMGYIVPFEVVSKWAKVTIDPTDKDGVEFDTINGKLICEKYISVSKVTQSAGAKGKKPVALRMIDGQVRLHVDTDNLRRNAFKIKPDDFITISYKLHGTSWWVGNLLVKKKLSVFDKVLKWAGVGIIDTEYDVLYGSRRVVKNSKFSSKEPLHYYGYDLWEDIASRVSHCIPKGYTLYGECVGYDKTGNYIQKPFDYGNTKGKFSLVVYRITYTNVEGFVVELSSRQIDEFCKRYSLNRPPIFYNGLAGDLYNIPIDNHWNETFIKMLEKDYTEKDCFMCANKVPEEGIVIQKQSLFSCEPFKLKSFRFLELESKNMDKGVVDIEESN